MKNIIAILTAVLAVGLAAPAAAQPSASCSAPCTVTDPWQNIVTSVNGGAWEKIWPGPVSPAQPKLGPWEKAFQNAPMK